MIVTNNSPIKFFVTGGTFDKAYNEIRGELFFEHTHLPEMLDLARNRTAVEIETLMMVDSLVMTESQRQDIVDACAATPHEKIIVTHGTDTMVVTAKALAALGLPKTIVLTGAMIPYKFGSSDGLFNLGSAMAYANVLPKGVYIAMNGEYFPWDNVRKDQQAGRFVRLTSS